MPFTSRLEAEEKNIGRITENGMLIVAALTSGPLFAAATFSLPLLKLWISTSLAEAWIWQSIGFSGPLLTVLLGFGFNTLFGRIHVNRAINRYIIIRIVIQYALALALAGLLAERAFILSGIFAVIATSYWEFRMIFREHGLNLIAARSLLSMAGIGLILLFLFLPTLAYIHAVWQLALIGIIFCVIYYALVWCVALPHHLREKLGKHLLRGTFTY